MKKTPSNVGYFRKIAEISSNAGQPAKIKFCFNKSSLCSLYKITFIVPPQIVEPSTVPEGHRHYFVVFTGRGQL